MGRTPDEDRPKTEPSLELPTLRLPRVARRKHRVAEPTQPDAASRQESATPAPEPAPVERRTAPAPAPTAPLADDKTPAAFRLPAIPGRVAAALTGLVVGAAGVALTYLALAGCEAARGTSTCGGPGLLLLVAIVLVMVLMGGLALAAWQVSSPGSTSALGVGLVCAVSMLVLLDVIFSAWMFLVIPLLAAASYTLSHWVTTRFSDERRESSPIHDLR